MSGVKFEKRLLLGVIYDGDDMLQEDWERFEKIEDLRLSDTRWSANYCLTFAFEGDCYELFYSRGLTEAQDETPLQNEGEWVECEKVADPRMASPSAEEEGDSAFWVHNDEVARIGSEQLEQLRASLDGEERHTTLPLGARIDWPCGSFFESVLLPVVGGFAFRIAHAVRGGAVTQQVFECSKWTRPAEPDLVPLAAVSLEGSVCRDFPFSAVGGDVDVAPTGAICVVCREVVPWSEGAIWGPDGPCHQGCEGKLRHARWGKLSERAVEVLTNLDGRRVRVTKDAKERPACVVCLKGIMKGDLYEHQKDKASSPRRRVHVECLKDLGLA